MEKKFTMPAKWHRLAPCREKDCGHASCERLREIAASPCMLCRHVIGYGLTILDERTQEQIDSEVFYMGFVHANCRKRWKAKYQPKARKSPPYRPRKPHTPTPVHLDDEFDF